MKSPPPFNPAGWVVLTAVLPPEPGLVTGDRGDRGTGPESEMGTRGGLRGTSPVSGSVVPVSVMCKPRWLSGESVPGWGGGTVPAVLDVTGRDSPSHLVSHRKSSMEGLSRGRLSCCSLTSCGGKHTCQFRPFFRSAAGLQNGPQQGFRGDAASRDNQGEILWKRSKRRAKRK